MALCRVKRPLYIPLLKRLCICQCLSLCQQDTQKVVDENLLRLFWGKGGFWDSRKLFRIWEGVFSSDFCCCVTTRLLLFHMTRVGDTIESQ